LIRSQVLKGVWPPHVAAMIIGRMVYRGQAGQPT